MDRPHKTLSSWLVVSSPNALQPLPSFAVIGLLVPFTTLLDPNLGFTLYPTLVAVDSACRPADPRQPQG